MTIENPHSQADSVRSVLEKHGISATRQRREIGALLFDRAQHVTAEQVMDRLADRGNRVSKATVYNTLRLFVDKGLLREVHADANRTVFDTTTTPHHHFLNVITGELQDVPAGAVAFAALPVPPAGARAEDVEVTIRIRDRD